MVKFMKKVLSSVIVATLVFSTPVLAAPGSNTVPNVPQTATDEHVAATVDQPELTVDTDKDGVATIVSFAKTKEKTITVPSTVVVNNVEYSVVEIKAKAFKNASKATKVVIPKTITKIDKKAFSGAKKLETIKFNNTKNITVAKGAFKGLKTSKMKIVVTNKMSKKQFKKFKETLEKAGFKGTIKRQKATKKTTTKKKA